MEPLSLVLGIVLGLLLGILLSRSSPVSVVLNQPASNDSHAHYYPEPIVEIMEEAVDVDADDDDGEFPDWRGEANR